MTAHPDIVAQIQARINFQLPSFPADVQAQYAATEARAATLVNPDALPNPQ